MFIHNSINLPPKQLTVCCIHVCAVLNICILWYLLVYEYVRVLCRGGSKLKMYKGHDYPLERGQEPLIWDVRPWWLPFSPVSLSREHHIIIWNPKSSPFYAPTGYWYHVERRISIECYINLFPATIKCNVSQFIPLLIIGNHPSASLKAHAQAMKLGTVIHHYFEPSCVIVCYHRYINILGACGKTLVFENARTDHEIP